MTVNSPAQPLIVRLILPLLILGMVAFGVYWQQPDLRLGNRKPALPTPPSARIEPRPTPHEAVIPLINGKVQNVRFASNRRNQPYDQWQYGDHFQKNQVYLVSTLIDLVYPAAQQQYQFKLEFIYYKDAEAFGSCTSNIIVEVAAEKQVQICDFGWDQPGLFPAGPYFVEVLYEGEVVANGRFEIDE